MNITTTTNGGFSAYNLNVGSIYRAAFTCGIALHIFIFRLGEWDLYTARLMIGVVIVHGILTTTLMHTYAVLEFKDSFQTVTIALSLCIAGVYSSMLVYRGVFHRLNKFPGPFMARLSNFYITSRSIKHFRLFEEVQQMHEEYGDIVRIGPSELSITDPRALEIIHTNQSPCVKGPWYNILHPVVSLQMVRDHKEHSRRRRVWDKGFSTKALKDYEPRVSMYTDQLMKKIKESEGKALNMADWFNFYSFDVMGDLAFGKSFDMLKDGIKHNYMSLIHKNMINIGIFTHLVWIFPILKAIPGLNYENEQFQKWLYEHVRKRRERGSAQQDVFSWILKSYEEIETPTKQDFTDLHGDAELIVVAGSDTTAATLTCLFFELARHPEITRKLQAEIDNYYLENEGANSQALAKLEYLEACINETLRLYPPVPSGVQRMTPPQGLQIGSAFIPGNTVVQVPTYTVQRDKRSFEKPNEYIPERWTTQQDLINNTSVFAPFSIGRYSCVGKQLALMELRYVTATILRLYNLEEGPQEAKKTFHTGLVDAFTLSSPETLIIFHRR